MVMGFSLVWSYTLDSSLRCGKAYVSFDAMFVTVYSMSALGRLSLSVDFHVHLQVVATRKRFSK